ncbi:hypothetical protein M431DRAFT_309084 [Trichoderma harzianum CBS 226.95]|uniref:Uncharacterized protein n=1 Tax=Trichoderma harzianum CBS 226.95 TaxID=983964 RepID=A0A2T4ARA1_TRIHA|nr:hypothetical protein M431DRAFT_309084 [Trichoderma harzianum CBS 226.95]PTB59607.1 hypothetical protein M431DRAFT_309084 [Trichoderma harzianum CBS 226.95]
MALLAYYLFFNLVKHCTNNNILLCQFIIYLPVNSAYLSGTGVEGKKQRKWGDSLLLGTTTYYYLYAFSFFIEAHLDIGCRGYYYLLDYYNNYYYGTTITATYYLLLLLAGSAQ